MASKEQPRKALSARDRKGPRIDDSRLHALRQAIAHTPHQDKETRHALHMALSEALGLALQDPRRAAEHDALTLERAHALFHARCFEKAGQLFESLDRLALAERCYRQAGAIEHLEQIYERQSQAQTQQQHRTAFVAKLDEAFGAGRRKLVLMQAESVLQDPTLRGQTPELLGQLQGRVKEIRARIPARSRIRLRLQYRVESGQEPGLPLEVALFFVPSLTLGRSPQADVLCNDASLSRQHASILATEHGFELQDLASKTGTYLDGDALEPQEAQSLFPGQTHQIGLGYSSLMHAYTEHDASWIELWQDAQPTRRYLLAHQTVPLLCPRGDHPEGCLSPMQGLTWSIDPQSGMLTLSRQGSCQATITLQGQPIHHHDPIEVLVRDRIVVKDSGALCSIEVLP